MYPSKEATIRYQKLYVLITVITVCMLSSLKTCSAKAVWLNITCYNYGWYSSPWFRLIVTTNFSHSNTKLTRSCIHTHAHNIINLNDLMLIERYLQFKSVLEMWIKLVFFFFFFFVPSNQATLLSAKDSTMCISNKRWIESCLEFYGIQPHNHNSTHTLCIFDMLWCILPFGTDWRNAKSARYCAITHPCLLW